MLRLETVLIGELQSYTETFIAQGVNQTITPITLQRAIAQQRNPLASHDDVGLIVVYDDDLCIGHVGLIPGILRFGDQRIPILWSHSLYVQPEYRKTTAAFLLIRKLGALDRDIFVTGFNSASYDLCRAFGFRDLNELSYLTVNLQKQNLFGLFELRKSSLSARWRKRRGLDGTKHFKPSRAYRFFRNRYLTSQNRLAAECSHGWRWNVVETLQCQKYDDFGDVPVFERTIESVNWMIQYPWLVEGEGQDRPRYVFSHRRPVAKYVPIEIYDEQDNHRGFAVFFVTVRKGTKLFKLLDYPVQSAGIPMVAIATQIACINKVDQLFFPLELEQQIQRLFPSRLISRRNRTYQWLPKKTGSDSRRLIEQGPAIKLHYTNGDCSHI